MCGEGSQGIGVAHGQSMEDFQHAISQFLVVVNEHL